mmetsp:Transcript_44395/g.77467  ORF Transcript_44395/g.77467 Transcript_44395/m.77467 type:complete len:314 (-) Transcript_44395:210-1151(-)
MVTLDKLEVSSRSESVQEFEGHAVHRDRSQVQVLHAQVALVLLGEHVLAQLSDVVFREHGLYELLHEAADLGGERGGHVDEVLLHRGHVTHVLRHLLEGVLRRADQLEGLALELIVTINNGHKGFSDVSGRDGLHKGLSVLDKREERKARSGLGDPVQEAIFGTENSGWLHNDSFGEGLAHGKFTLGLGSRPLRLGLEVGRKGGHVDERFHASFLGNFRQNTGDCDVHLFEIVVDSGKIAVGSTGGNNVLGFVVLSNHVDHNITLLNRLADRFSVTRTERHKAELSQIKHWLQVANLHFAASVRDVNSGSALA